MEQSYNSDFLKRNLLPILLGAGGLIFIFVGVFAIFSQSKNTSQLQFQAGSQIRNQASSSASQALLIVDIEGSVMKPGVYSLPEGSRMHELIVLAGGLSQAADRDWYQKSLNQAAKLTDGQKVYIPRVGEQIAASGASSTSNISASSTIDINTASLRELDTLPGVGQVTAQKIVDNRPYSGINDLLSKKVVSSSVFDKLKDKISAN